MSTAIGIDVGTTSCRVAVVQNGKPAILSLSDGDATPNVLAFTEEALLVGAQAEREAAQRPEATVTGYMRLMGRKFHSPEVDWLRTCCPYTVVAAANGDARVHIEGRDYAPQELLSYVLEHLKREVEKKLDTAVADAVIAVPSCFDDLQRRSVLDAANLAGLPVSGLVSNTAAAAITHAAKGSHVKRVALVDFGAGCMDVGLADINGSAVEMLAVAGHRMLGGDDIDRRLILHFVDTFEEQTGLDATDEPGALVRFRERAIEAKQELSERSKTAPIVIPELLTRDGKKLDFEHPGVSRRRLVELIVEELQSVKEPCFWVFEDASLGTDDVDEVIAIGGVTRMPAALSALKYLFRAPPVRPKRAEVMVALGAARLAAARRGDLPAISCRDVLGASTGIKVRGGKLLPVVPRNAPIPCREVRMFHATSGQDAAVFELYQGEHELATDNTYVGRFSVGDVSREERFPVAFRVDESAVLHVSRIDHRTGEEQPVNLARSSGLSTEELEALRKNRSWRAKSRPPRPTPRVELPLPGMPADKVQIDESPSRVFTRERPGTVSDAPTIARPAPKPKATGDGTIEVGADALVGTTLGDRYVVESIIADGGMGRVYKARHKLLKKVFAIKVLHPELAVSRDIAERFVREAQAASSIESDHVVDISDFGLIEDGTGYFVMEYLDGETLEHILDRRGPLPAAMVRSVGMQVADGLRGAHEEHIVHRDLKPANIVLLERPDHPYFCKILDFGIAKNPTSDSSTLITRVGIMMGTPHYMAPEQIDGRVDARSDVYALGLVLFEMLTGSPPFDAESVAELLAKQKWEDPPRVHEICPVADCPEALEAVIRRCLEKEPADRYQSAVEAAEALQKVELPAT
jgi:molecular chaperone DnaK